MREIRTGPRLTQRRRRTAAGLCLSLAVAACSGDHTVPPDHAGAEQPLRIGVSHAQQRVFLQPLPNDQTRFDPSEFRVALARHEVESIQLVLWPGDDAADVVLEVGATPPGLTVSLHPIGYIHLAAPRKKQSRTGWYPDILLDNQPLTLVPAEPQPVLVSVQADSDASAGSHVIEIGIVTGTKRRTLPLTVEVFDFELPRVSAFKAGNLFDWQTPDVMWPQALGYPPLDDAARERIMFAVADLGFRNRLPPTFFFANGLKSWNYKGNGNTRVGFPSHDDGKFNEQRVSRYIDYLLEKGANHFFIGLTANLFEPQQPDLVARRKAALRSYLDDYVALLRRRDIEHLAYLYGIDEPWGEAVDQARATYQLVKPWLGNRVRFLQNTNQNKPSILARLRDHFDAIDINLGWFDATGLDAARERRPAEFKEVWWNVNLWPDTHPNLFLEYPLTDARSIGSLSFRYHIQGYEYWQLFYAGAMTRYQPLRPNAFRVDWGLNDKSMDGNLIYPGQGYRIYSSLRFEALRDGFEDLEYLYLLAQRRPGHPLLRVPWVESITRFERDTDKLALWRRELAQAIMSAR